MSMSSTEGFSSFNKGAQGRGNASKEQKDQFKNILNSFTPDEIMQMIFARLGDKELRLLSKKLHERGIDDNDRDAGSHHHTTGPMPYQAAPGKHDSYHQAYNDARYSKIGHTHV